ncbi:Phosphopentomutase (plasmid) [Piscirickettsia salmonis]|uniref:phosphopentomutase n=1 Tax=Piscirickettsia salmonis TaxID=1238 RepID=UPI0002E1EE3F|nr:phosphopentomutase [Piscirickettsia salmonis]QGO66871.1 Phosphopentomutase [Piscirickettsia salmonis]QGO68515.1 Phosphopentomutase [Piscirickettsia salmonis]
MLKGRVIILLMDSFGIGASEDAEQFGDVGADTFGHIVEHAAHGLADSPERQGALKLPYLASLGLEQAAKQSRGRPIAKTITGDLELPIQGVYGYAIEQSCAKDTTSGHWEITGVPVEFEWDYFHKTAECKTPGQDSSCFPADFMQRFLVETGLTQGVLDAGHASGTEVINRLGDEHCLTGKPIVYTSADSVFQIACHEKSFGLERLYGLCETARELFDEMGLNIGRVIARPFVGNKAGEYQRTGNRHDYSVPPPQPTLLEYVVKNGGEVISVGKIADIFADRGISHKVKATGITELFDQSLAAFKRSKAGSLVFTNFVDFDSQYGHRRDVAGYAKALEYFDSRLPELMDSMEPGDLMILTADHGCDPTWPGSDHTREHIPVLAWGPGLQSKNIGQRHSFADIGQSIADFMGLAPLAHGQSFLS